MSLIHLFKKMKHWNRDIIGYRVIGAGCLLEKDLKLSLTPPNCSTDSWKLLPLVTSIHWPSLVASCGSKDISKIHPVLCINTHHDVTDLANHGMVKNTKTRISWEWNITFLQHKQILNLCLRWHTLKSYHFVT